MPSTVQYLARASLAVCLSVALGCRSDDEAVTVIVQPAAVQVQPVATGRHAGPASAARQPQAGSDPPRVRPRANYTKYEYRIPMRDGYSSSPPFTSQTTRAPQALPAPDDADAVQRRALRGRSVLAPPGAPAFEHEGYIFVYQDVRGWYMSEGEFVNMRPAPGRRAERRMSTRAPTPTTPSWLVKNVADNNGRVGQWGISYPGFYTAAGMIDAHPALNAVSPQAPIADWFRRRLPPQRRLHCRAFNFLSGFGKPRPRPYPTRAASFDSAPGRLPVLPRAGRSVKHDRRYFKGEVAFWNEMSRTRTTTSSGRRGTSCRT